MPLTSEEVKALRRIYKYLRALPAFEDVVIKRTKLQDAHGMTQISADGKKRIYISSDLNYTDTLDTLAHECAHLLVDPNGSHNPLFNIMNSAMLQVIALLPYV
mgnify:CR=1 FL=1